MDGSISYWFTSSTKNQSLYYSMKQAKGKFQGALANPKLVKNLCVASNGQPTILVAGWRSMLLDAHILPSSIKKNWTKRVGIFKLQELIELSSKVFIFMLCSVQEILHVELGSWKLVIYARISYSPSASNCSNLKHFLSNKPHKLKNVRWDKLVYRHKDFNLHAGRTVIIQISNQ